MKATTSTYYIIKIGDSYINGGLESGQELSTSHPYDLYLDYAEYVNQCTLLEIDPTDEIIINVPFTISTLQGKLQLIKMGLLDTLEAMIDQSGQPEKVYWEYSATWERSSPILNRLAPMIGMSQADLDQFFIEASKLR